MASGRPVANELEGYPSRTLVTATFLKKNSPFLSHSNILQHFDPKCSQERTRHACQAAQTAPRPPKEATRNLKSSQEASKSSQGAPAAPPPSSSSLLLILLPLFSAPCSLLLLPSEPPSPQASKPPSLRATKPKSLQASEPPSLRASAGAGGRGGAFRSGRSPFGENAVSKLTWSKVQVQVWKSVPSGIIKSLMGPASAAGPWGGFSPGRPLGDQNSVPVLVGDLPATARILSTKNA